MKIILLTAVFSLAAASRLMADDGTNVLGDDKSKASYAIGMMLGHNWQQQGIDVDMDMVLRGLKDGQSGGATLLTQQEMQSTLKAFQQSIAAKQQKIRAEQAVKNKADGEAFLATNKNNPGVVTLPDGLQYKVITDGTGETPSPEDTVSVNYRGTLLDGTEFDSSAKAGHPVQFQAGHVIRGWVEALTQMKVGSKWQLFIPSDLAYAEQGTRGIQPNSTLIFDVDLLSVQHPQPSSAPASQPMPPPTSDMPPPTSDIIKVPSKAEMDKGAQVQVLKPEDVQKLQQSGSQQGN